MDSRSGGVPPLNRGLAGYLRAVAEAVGVSVEATSFEISDTVTAYLGLTRRWSARPGEDLMLVWSERNGWAVAVETDPGEASMVLAYYPGDDLVPTPAAVAGFVTDVIATGGPTTTPRPIFPTTVARDELTKRLGPYA